MRVILHFIVKQRKRFIRISATRFWNVRFFEKRSEKTFKNSMADENTKTVSNVRKTIFCYLYINIFRTPHAISFLKLNLELQLCWQTTQKL